LIALDLEIQGRTYTFVPILKQVVELYTKSMQPYIC